MSKPLLILVHGAGLYSENWAEKHIAKIDELAENYPGISSHGKFTDLVDVKPIRYDDVFQERLNTWEELGDELDGFRAEIEGMDLSSALAVLRQRTLPGDERDFVLTHVLDPVLYRGSPSVRSNVRADVAAELLGTIDTHLKENPDAQVSIMCHSLGTIATHDVLHLIYSGQTDIDPSDLRPINNLFQVTNASRLIPRFRDIDPYKSVVRPGTAPALPEGKNAVDVMFSFRNKWDPITWWWTFHPTNWGGKYSDVRVAHILHANVHGLIHYLTHPTVHGTIFRQILGPTAVRKSEIIRAAGAFQHFAPCPAALSDFKERLTDLFDAVEKDFNEFIVAVLELYRAGKSLRAACPELEKVADLF